MPQAWSKALFETGRAQIDALATLWQPLASSSQVSPKSALLCAALAELATQCYRGLGGERSHDAVARAAATLALLTKVDDQIIDSPRLHDQFAPEDLAAKERRCRQILGPTLEAILAPAREPTSLWRTHDPAQRPSELSEQLDHDRLALARSLGRQLLVLAEGDRRRLADIHQQIAAGWAIQARAVALLTAPPQLAGSARIAQVSAAISSAWLMMITACGSLPPDSARLLNARERRAFWRWGNWIQRVDALADFPKDILEGHRASYPQVLLYQSHGQAALEAHARQDSVALLAMLAEADLDRRCLPPGPEELEDCRAELEELGEVGGLLAWIHGFLTRRYLLHPGCRRDPQDPGLLPFLRNCPDSLSSLGYVDPPSASASGWRDQEQSPQTHRAHPRTPRSRHAPTRSAAPARPHSPKE